MESFMLTREMAVEMDGLADEQAREFGRAFSDLIDIGILGVSLVHFFAPHEHTINAMAGEFLDAGQSGQAGTMGHITPQYLDPTQLSKLQREVSAGLGRGNTVASNPAHEAEVNL